MGHNRRLKEAPKASLGQAAGGGGGNAVASTTRTTSITGTLRSVCDKGPPGPLSFLFLVLPPQRVTSIPGSVRDKAPPGPNAKGCDLMKPHLQPPWAIGGCYAELQRWIYLGTGTYRMCFRARAHARSRSRSLSRSLSFR